MEDVLGDPVPIDVPVRGGVRPLTLQAECGFHAYGEMRLGAERLEAPAPGIDARDRGMLLHKALEMVWLKLERWFHLNGLDTSVRKPMIHQAVEAAEAYVYRGFVPPDIRPAVEREKMRLERLIEDLLLRELKRPSFVVEQLEARRQVSIAGGTFDIRIDRIDSIEGGGFAILDYKSGESAALRWDGESIRDPQLLAYLLAEQGRDVQALANVSLTRGRARFVGKASRKGLLPGVSGVKGINPDKVDAGQIGAIWQGELEQWLRGLQRVAAAYLAGQAPVEPGSDVCRNCHLTVLCRRVELTAAALERGANDE
jgi:ATP-dependent helicase/nuclease subunit B